MNKLQRQERKDYEIMLQRTRANERGASNLEIQKMIRAIETADIIMQALLTA